jgi:hypothetical protein
VIAMITILAAGNALLLLFVLHPNLTSTPLAPLKLALGAPACH